MDGGGRLPELFHKVGTVVDEHRPGLGHAERELVQGLQERRLLLAVPQNPGLVLVEPLVLRQGLGVAGPQLADALVQEAAPLRGPLPDEVEVLRAEEHALKKPGELPDVLQRHAVGLQLPSRPPVELRFQQVLPLVGGNAPLQEGMVHPELDELPVIPSPVADPGEVGHGL